jgi:hypothetical protein
MRLAPSIEPYLKQLRTLPFVSDLRFSPEDRLPGGEADGILKLRTPKATYRFLIE